MTDWRKFVEERDWLALEGWLSDNVFLCSDADETVQREALGKAAKVLDWLQANVPMVTEENGIEIRKRHVYPEEAPDEWKGAAFILMLGELKSIIDGDPPTDTEQWGELLHEITPQLDSFLHEGEVSKGDKCLSRSSHAKNVLVYLEEIRKIEIVSHPGDGPFDKAWLKEVVSGAAFNAFMAGREYEIALKKHTEDSAVRGEKVAGGAQNSAKKINEKHAALRNKRMARMRELTTKMAVTNAAMQCEFEKLGSAAAIRAQWYRWRENCDT